jgi:peptidyl-tRNA hydrolase ICT1
MLGRFVSSVSIRSVGSIAARPLLIFREQYSTEANATPRLTETEQHKPPVTDGLNFSGYIPVDQLKISYTRSSGPGGQHVNTTSSKVDVRFSVASASWLSPELKKRLLDSHPQAVNKDGYFIVKSEKTRSQHLNLADCLDKLRRYIWQSAEVPAPPSEESIERRRRLLERAARQRLSEKRERSAAKASRRPPTL